MFLSLDPFPQPHALELSPQQHRQILVPGRGAQADSQGGFGMGGTQVPRAHMGRGDPDQRGGSGLAQMGAPPSAHGG